MSERQRLRGLPNLAAAFGVREACFRFGLSHASMPFGIGRTGKLEAVLFQVQRQWPGRRPHRPAQKLRCSPHDRCELLVDVIFVTVAFSPWFPFFRAVVMRASARILSINRARRSGSAGNAAFTVAPAATRSATTS